MYLISYDISENKRRNKIFKELKNYGRHVQFSVFECELDRKRYRQLYTSTENRAADEEQETIVI